MLWLDEWTAWSARYTATLDILRLYGEGRALAEHYGASNETVVPELKALFPLLDDFHKRFGSQLPTGAQEALSSFIFQHQRKKTFDTGNGIGSFQGALFMAGLLGTVKSQVDYFLADKQVRARRAVERAFTHLQRSLIADKKGLGRRWRFAFHGERAEEACEKLGAVHLLLHGIWAFKADAAGGKTDLILGEAVKDEEAVRASDAMVLTEWKMVREKDDPVVRARQALEQAEQYTRNTLAGFELSSHRYLVLVSEDYIAPPPAVASPPGRNYEVRNIAVNPSTPSKMAVTAAAAAPARPGGS
jgi:hypothetical protein